MYPISLYVKKDLNILGFSVKFSKHMESYPSGLRERSAKPSFSGSNPLDSYRAPLMELFLSERFPELYSHSKTHVKSKCP